MSTAVGYPADVANLLAPIPGDRPTGISLRFEGTYDLVRDARREDDPNLPQGVWRAERKQARWPEVDTVCRAALERSKDL